MRRSAFCCLAVLAAALAQAATDAASALAYVDPLVGTEGTGSQYGGMQPYTCVPFGSFHAVPMTRTNRIGRLSFNSADETLLGIILTRQPAIWMGDWGEVRIPLAPAKLTALDARPYLTRVTAGARTYELTATAHAAWIRGLDDATVAAFPASGTNTNRMDAKYGYPLPHFGGRWYAEKAPGELRIGLSLISVEQAKANLAREIGARDFASVVAGTKALWESYFGRIAIDAPEDVKRIFYTGLYHTLLYPRQMDEDGRYYSAFDDKVHAGTRYNCYSLWDTYRTEHPWLTLIAPERVDGMMQSLVDMYREGGWLPKWPNPSYTGIMIGAPAEVVLEEAMAKGFTGFDHRTAREAIRKNATVPQAHDTERRWQDRGMFGTAPETRAGLTSYLARGYVACDETAESVSRTQDFSLADRNKAYTNVWCAAEGMFLPRRADGTFVPRKALERPFRDYCEQQPETGVWAVPHDPEGLAQLMGGKAEAIRRLDAFFDTLFFRPDGRGNGSIHGNETSHHCAYLYNRFGAPEKTQRRVRQILTKCYSTSRKGFDGNEDCGQMSAWYIMSALGLYPLDPVSGFYEIGSPLVASADLRIGEKTLRLRVENYAPGNWRVARVLFNGRPVADWRIAHADLVRGGELRFVMCRAESAAVRELPTAWAPLATDGSSRQACETLFLDYRTGPVWAPSKEQYRWAELKCGDKSVLLAGTERRVSGMSMGGAGFGHVVLYAGKTEIAKPGETLLGDIRFRLKHAGGPWNEPWPTDTVAREGDAIVRTRPWACAGTNGVFTYRAEPTGPGRVRITWDAGVDRATWTARNLARHIDFPVETPVGAVKPLTVKEGVWEYFPEDPARHVTVTMTPAGPTGTLDIDFHASSAPRLAALPPVGGIDFWRTDAYDVPVRPGRNQVMNGSFEQGFKGWTFNNRGMALEAVTNAPAGYRFTRVEEGGKFGRHALHFNARGLTGDRPGLASAPMALVPGKVYTFSVWCRGERGGMCFFGMRPAGREPQQEWVGGKVPKTLVKLTPEWQRLSYPFIASPEGECVLIWLSADDTWIDGVMVEEGDRATETVFDPVEARLETSDARNYVRRGAQLDARVALTGAPGLAGTVEVEVENGYHERLYARRFDFTLDAKGEGCLPLDDMKTEDLGTGVFFVRFNFTAQSPTPNPQPPTPNSLSWRDYSRFTIIEPLAGTHPLAGHFAHFPWFKGVFGCAWSADYSDLLADRMRDWGIGATATVSNGEYADGHWAKSFRAIPLVDKMHTLNEELSHFYPKDFGWGKVGLKAYTNATPEELSFVENAAYRAAKAAHPTSRYWALGGEEELWHPLVNRDRDFDRYFKFQYACWKGLKRGFDERGLKFLYAPSQGTSAFFHITQHAIIDGYLTAADKQGFKYDFVAIHTYHSIDGSTLGAGDRDADADVLLGLLRKHGYPETTPISFPEGFNMLPMHIPAWRARDWADCYQGTIPSHALGNREALQAAALCRGYLVDLKRYPRLVVEHTWLHRPILDIDLTPYLFTTVMNTLGRILPDPRFVGDAKPYADVRGYCFHPTPDATRGVLAVWTTNHGVENGVRKGDVLEMDLPADATFLDFTGNPRRAAEKGKVPLTAAPLFILSSDAEGLVTALRNAKGGRHEAVAAQTWRQVAVPKETATPRAPVSLDGRRRGNVRAEASFDWTSARFRVTVTAHGVGSDAALDVAFDGLIDARRTGATELAPDDFAFRFTQMRATRTKEPNTQFRYGGASKDALSDAEAAAAVTWTCRRTSDGCVWDILFPPKIVHPARLVNGNCFGLDLRVEDAGGSAALAPSASPQTFAEILLD